MAQVTPQHVPVLTAGFVGLLTLAVVSIGILNYLANK